MHFLLTPQKIFCIQTQYYLKILKKSKGIRIAKTTSKKTEWEESL